MWRFKTKNRWGNIFVGIYKYTYKTITKKILNSCDMWRKIFKWRPKFKKIQLISRWGAMLMYVVYLSICVFICIEINSGSMSSSLLSTKQLLDTNDDVIHNERMTINVISINKQLKLCSNGRFCYYAESNTMPSAMSNE